MDEPHGGRFTAVRCRRDECPARRKIAGGKAMPRFSVTPGPVNHDGEKIHRKPVAIRYE